ncbi:ESX-1 secretion-associated protein EspA [Mycobacterium marinum]|uniref:ESX-1 secretion-associated protein EspA n=4 Tax=Mycobacterium marinum TaxID=1781 RepID=A0A3E2MXG6_MYCMR|nr:ESX-1 secretion-associated protein EspA [Mycobacterium marinum]
MHLSRLLNWIRWIIAESGAENETNPLEEHLGSVICAVTEGFLGGGLAWLGDGGPEPGGCLIGSGAMFDDVAAHIAGLDPEGRWQGAAARAYSAQNSAQSQHAALIADLDRLAAELVSSQSGAVQDARDFICGEIGFVLFVFALCIYLELQGPEGQLASVQVAVPLCSSMLFLAAFRLILLHGTTSRNANDVEAVAQQLTDISASVPACSETIPGSPGMGLAAEVSM